MKDLFNTFQPEEEISCSDADITKQYIDIYTECYTARYRMIEENSIRLFAESSSNFFGYIMEKLKKLFNMIKRFFKTLVVRLKKDKREYEREINELKSTIDACSKYTFTEKATITLRDLNYRIIGGTPKYAGIIKGIINTNNAVFYSEYDDLTVGNVVAISTDIMANINTYTDEEIKKKLDIIDGSMKVMKSFNTPDMWTLFIYKQTVSPEDAKTLDMKKSLSENITNLHGTKRITLRGNDITQSEIGKVIHDSIMSFDISNMMRVLDDGEAFFTNYGDKFEMAIKKLSIQVKHTMTEKEYKEKYNFATIYSKVLTNFASTCTQVFNTSKIELDTYLDVVREYCDELSRCKEQYGTMNE